MQENKRKNGRARRAAMCTRTRRCARTAQIDATSAAYWYQM